MSDRSRRLALVVALLVAVFVAGVAVGVMADRLVSHAPVIRTRVTQDMSHVLDRLELTPEQRARAESILSRQAPRSESLMVDMAQRLHRVSDSIDAELREILRPAQRARLDSLRTREPQLMLKRKVVTPRGTRVDTFIPVPPRRDSTKP